MCLTEVAPGAAEDALAARYCASLQCILVHVVVCRCGRGQL